MVSESAARRKRAQAWLWEYLQGRGCDICGETSPILLEFDHRNTLEKDYNISRMVSQGYAIESIEAEIAKCDILCVLCHRLKTAQDQRWYSTFIDWDDPQSWTKYVLTPPANEIDLSEICN